MRFPSLKFLKTSQVAAARQSFKAAADELFITPSAVSHQIRALEEQLGILLFERGPHSLTLSEAGQQYLRHVDSIFTRLEAVTEQLQINHGRDVLRVNVPPFFATEMLLPRLTAFLEAQPDTDIHINTLPATPQAHAPSADLSIVVGAAPSADHDCHKLFSQIFVPACSPTLLLRQPIEHADELSQHTLIAHEARRDGWHRWAQSAGIDLRPRKVIRFDTMYAAAHAAEGGIGVALVSEPLAAARFAQGSLVRLFDAELETGESYFLVTRKEDSVRPDIRALVSWIIEEFGVAA